MARSCSVLANLVADADLLVALDRRASRSSCSISMRLVLDLRARFPIRVWSTLAEALASTIDTSWREFIPAPVPCARSRYVRSRFPARDDTLRLERLCELISIARCSFAFWRSISSGRISVWLLIRSASMSRSLAMRTRSASCSVRIWALLMLMRGIGALLLDLGELRGPRVTSMARDWSMRAYSRSRSISKARCSAS